MSIDRSTANLATLRDINSEREAPIVIRQFKYLSNILKQDHRAIKRVLRPTTHPYRDKSLQRPSLPVRQQR
ncbi:Integrase catalytic region [Cupriavidus basilensis OR16]|uniref:Integrase catalytic region n=1 Tax=Cupriavidus basilensis OR16 TaxID=1127483 RepID=H1SC09_9BURK|nr:Integrase catalytic region [Cupriavidus basilensis OR16]